MSNVLHRTTLEYLSSVSTVKYLDGNWLINPALPTCPKCYWKVVGDNVVEMDAGEKAAVDAQAAIELRYRPKSRMEILNEIYAALTPITEDVIGHRWVDVDGVPTEQSYVVRAADDAETVAAKLEQQARLFAVLNDNALWLNFLDDNSYGAAREYLQRLLSAEVILQADYDLIDAIMPMERVV